jgi:hypothetical protein
MELPDATIQRAWRRRVPLAQLDATRLQRQWRVTMSRSRWRRLLAFGLVAVENPWPTVSLIQRCWRRARLRRRYAGIVQALTDRYMPEEMKGGTESLNEWYTPAMILRRERMWRSDRVQAALDKAWCAARSFGTESSSSSSERADHQTLGWHEYKEIARKVYLALTRRNDPIVATALAVSDWKSDTHGGGPDARLDRGAFFRSWFELTDVHTDTMDVDAYVSFLEQLIDKIVYTDTGHTEPRHTGPWHNLSLLAKEAPSGSGPGQLQVESRVRWVIAFGRSRTLRRGIAPSAADTRPGGWAAQHAVETMPRYGRREVQVTDFRDSLRGGSTPRAVGARTAAAPRWLVATRGNPSHALLRCTRHDSDAADQPTGVQRHQLPNMGGQHTRFLARSHTLATSLPTGPTAAAMRAAIPSRGALGGDGGEGSAAPVPEAVDALSHRRRASIGSHRGGHGRLDRPASARPLTGIGPGAARTAPEATGCQEDGQSTLAPTGQTAPAAASSTADEIARPPAATSLESQAGRHGGSSVSPVSATPRPLAPAHSAPGASSNGESDTLRPLAPVHSSHDEGASAQRDVLHARAASAHAIPHVADPSASRRQAVAFGSGVCGSGGGAYGSRRRRSTGSAGVGGFRDSLRSYASPSPPSSASSSRGCSSAGSSLASSRRASVGSAAASLPRSHLTTRRASATATAGSGDRGVLPDNGTGDRSALASAGAMRPSAHGAGAARQAADAQGKDRRPATTDTIANAAARSGAHDRGASAAAATTALSSSAAQEGAHSQSSRDSVADTDVEAPPDVRTRASAIGAPPDASSARAAEAAGVAGAASGARAVGAQRRISFDLNASQPHDAQQAMQLPSESGEGRAPGAAKLESVATQLALGAPLAMRASRAGPHMFPEGVVTVGLLAPSMSRTRGVPMAAWGAASPTPSAERAASRPSSAAHRAVAPAQGRHAVFSQQQPAPQLQSITRMV